MTPIPIRPTRSAVQGAEPFASLRRWIWIYCALWIFEGALRKWVVPQFSAPLLLVRDPLAIWIVWCAVSRGVKIPRLGRYFVVLCLLMLLAVVQWSVGLVSAPVALYGVRSYGLHILLIPLIGFVFAAEGMDTVARRTILVSIPMALLMAVQYAMPADAFVNSGAGEGAGQIQSSGGHVRASGTFSFVTGTQCFFTLVAAFSLWGFMKKGQSFRGPLVGMLCFITAVPLSGSRTLVVSGMFVVLVATLCGLLRIGSYGTFVRAMVLVVMCVLVALQVPLVSEAVSTLQDRWTEASVTEGSTGDVLGLRVFGVFIEGFDAVRETGWLGQGIGLGSNMASVFETGVVGFLLAETEWPRVVQEMGPIFGLSYLVFRAAIGVELALVAISLVRLGNVLPMLLASVCVPQLLLANMEQPTALGFLIISVGLAYGSASATVPYSKVAHRRQRRSAMGLGMGMAPSRY